MAETVSSPTDNWRQLRRAHRTARFNPRISIRRNGVIAISSDFVRMTQIEKCTRASLFLSPDGFKLGMNFHTDEKDNDAFLLTRDGGGPAKTKSLNRIICASTLLSQSSVVAALAKEDARTRRYEPKKDIDGKWVVSLAPCFERTLSQSDEIATGETGIYRYRLGSETIYIGRGDLRRRFSLSERRAWDFDRIEYSILNDDAIEKRWESFWLDEYRERNHRWPVHNRIAATYTAAKAG